MDWVLYKATLSIIISHILFITLTCPCWTSDQYFTHLKARQIVPLYRLGIIQGHCFCPLLFPTFYSSHEPVHIEPWSNNSIISRLSEQYLEWPGYHTRLRLSPFICPFFLHYFSHLLIKCPVVCLNSVKYCMRNNHSQSGEGHVNCKKMQVKGAKLQLTPDKCCQFLW